MADSPISAIVGSVVGGWVAAINTTIGLINGRFASRPYVWADSTARIAFLATAVMTKGEYGYQTDTEVTYRATSATAAVAWSSPWITYTPTLANTTLGSGTVTGKYRYVTGRVIVEGSFVLGAGSAVGTNPTISNPVNADTFSITAGFPSGDVRFADSGSALYFGFIAPINAATSEPFVTATAAAYAGATRISATIPFTFGTADGLYWHYEYTPA